MTAIGRKLPVKLVDVVRNRADLHIWQCEGVSIYKCYASQLVIVKIQENPLSLDQNETR